MRLYLAGNFTVTDEIENELELKKVMGKDYHRLCTYFYPKPADVIVQNVKPDIPKKVKINPEDLDKQTHKIFKTGKENEKKDCSQKTNSEKSKTKKVIIKRRKPKKRSNL